MAIIPPLAQVAQRALGVVLGSPFQWEGRLQGINSGVSDFYSGTGAPTTTTPPSPKTGAYYFRNDSPGGTSHVYYCSTGGNPATWVAIC